MENIASKKKERYENFDIYMNSMVCFTTRLHTLSLSPVK